MASRERENPIRTLLERISDVLEKELRNLPFKFVNEYDLQAYLYSLLSDCFQGTFPDSQGRAIVKVHTEYPRLYLKDGRLTDRRRPTRYDLVVLKEEPGIFHNENFKRKAVRIAFELKVLKNGSLGEVTRAFDGELPAFTSENNQVIPDFGVILALNFAKQSRSDLGDLKSKISRLCEQKDEALKRGNAKRSRLFYFYLECSPNGIAQESIQSLM